MIHAPCLMPDEDARGYWGRVLCLNAVPPTLGSEASFATRARSQFVGERNTLNDVALVISAVAGTSVAALIQAHTLVPHRGAVAGTVAQDWCDDSHASWELRNRGTSNNVHDRALCPMCADEDLRFWGFTYWRRSQQIAGLVWCQKHDCPLFHTPGPGTWRTMPHELLEKARPEADAVLVQTTENPVLLRHAEMCTELLNRSRPFASLQVLRSLTPRANKCGLVTDRHETGRRLSDVAVERISGPWQQRFWRELSGRAPGAYLPSLDDTLIRLRGWSWRYGYALTFALLYDSVDEAFNDLQRKLPTYRSLVPFLDAEAARVGRYAAARRRECTENRPQRLRLAAKQILSGSTLNSAACSVGWGGDSVGRMLVQCLTAWDSHLLREATRPDRSSAHTLG